MTGESELTPRHALTDLFEEELHLASVVIQRLRDAGFEIVPAERHQPRW
jgi:hypothetical protein